MNPLVSIIIPTYNRAHLIGETLDSILVQTYRNWECIIIDDGSVDNTKLVLQKYLDSDARFQYYSRPGNKIKGPNSCRNYGFEKSKGEYINWFDSDDLLFENALAERIENFENSFDVVVAKADFFDSNTGEILFTNNILSDSVVEDYFVGKITYYVSGPMWRRSFLEKQLELFDEKIRYLDDWDFNLRMIYQKPQIKFLDISLFKYRSHPYSLSKQINNFNIKELKSECIARNKHLEFLSEDGIISNQIKSFVLDRYRVMMRDTLVKKDKNSLYFFKALFHSQLRFKDFKGLVKTSLGFCIYYLFNKGYVLIK